MLKTATPDSRSRPKRVRAVLSVGLFKTKVQKHCWGGAVALSRIHSQPLSAQCSVLSARCSVLGVSPSTEHSAHSSLSLRPSAFPQQKVALPIVIERFIG